MPDPHRGARVLTFIPCNLLPVNALAHMQNFSVPCGSSESKLIYLGYLSDQEEVFSLSLVDSDLNSLQFHQQGDWGALVSTPARRRGIDIWGGD
jgi:hypothetical protein